MSENNLKVIKGKDDNNIIKKIQVEDIHENDIEQSSPKQTPILLSNLITKCQEAVKKNEFADLKVYLSSLKIKSYLPLLEKMTIAIELVSNQTYSDTETLEIKIVEYYKKLFFKVLLQHYCGVVIDNPKLETYSNYDLLYSLIGKDLLKYCKTDIDMLKEIVHESINMYNIKDMGEILSNINYDKLDDVTKSNKDLINDLKENQELIKSLRDLAVINSPQMGQIAEMMNIESNLEATEKLQDSALKDNE